MLDRIKNLFANVEPSKAEPSFDVAHMAAAVLLAYAAQVDGSLDQHEETVLKRITGPAFGLSEDEAAVEIRDRTRTAVSGGIEALRRLRRSDPWDGFGPMEDWLEGL